MSHTPAFCALEAEISPGSTPYSAGQVIGGLLSMGPVYGYSGLLVKGMTILDEDNQGVGLEVHLFDQPPEVIEDGMPFSPSYENLKKRLAGIHLSSGDYETVSSMKVAYTGDANLPVPASGCWLYLVSTGSVTFSAGKRLFVRVFVLG
jgi:hypothetical protein